MANALLKAPIILDAYNSTSGITVSGTNATVTAGTYVFPDGTTGVSCNAFAGVNFAGDKTVSEMYNDVNYLDIEFYISDYTKILNAGCLLLSNSGGFASGSDDYAQWTLNGTRYKTGYNKVYINREEFTLNRSGSFDKLVIKRRLRFLPTVSNDLSVQVHNFAKNEYHCPTVIFRFDDCLAEQYTKAFPILEGCGYKGGLFIISNRPDGVSAANHMTWAQLTELRTRRWTWHNHTKTHPDFSTEKTEKADQRQELDDCTDKLISMGGNLFDAHIFAYPNGGFNQNAIDALTEGGYTAGLLTTVETIHGNVPIPWDSPLTQKVSYVTNSTTVATVKSWIDYCVRMGTCMILTFHKIIDGTPSVATEYKTANFKQIVEYVKMYQSAGKLRVMSPGSHRRHYADGYKPNPPRSTGSNLLQYSEDISNAVWVKTGTASASDAKTLSFGSANDGVYQVVNTGAHNGKAYTFAMELSGSGTTEISLSDGIAGTTDWPLTITLTAEPIRYEVGIFFTSAQTSSSTVVNVGRTNSATATSVTIGKMSLQEGFSPAYIQRLTT